MRRMAALLLLSMSFAGNVLAERKLELDGGTIELVINGDALSVAEEQLEAWIMKSAQAVSVYFGRFPNPHVRLVVRGQPGKGVRGGFTEPTSPVTISVNVGSMSNAEFLMSEDWVMVHEMIHSGLPWLPRNYSWFHEGVAVYVESVARVQAGHLTQERALKDFVRQMPRGEGGLGGFDDSFSWAKTYWGGALFCLLADIEIRRQTSNRKGLQDALRAINALGSYTTDATLKTVLIAGDKGTGTSVLQDLYAKSAHQPISVDLVQIWRRLGVNFDGGTVTLDGSAPDASIRNSIFAL